MKKYLDTGKIVATQGLKGEVRIDPWCNDPDFLCSFKKIYLDENGENKLKVISKRRQKNIVIMKFENINDIDSAKRLCGKTIYIDRSDTKLEKGEYFIQDILGIDVFDDETNVNYGKVTDVFKTGANDVYEITNPENKKYLIPVIDGVVLKTDVEKRIMKIKPLKGIFDDEN